MLSRVVGKQHFYGWVALAGTTIVYFVGSGLAYAFGPFVREMLTDLHWTRGEIMWPATVAGEVGIILGPIVGLSMMRFGPRANMIYGNTMAALGLSLIFFVHEPWQLFVYRGVIAGLLGTQFGMYIACTSVANSWFRQRRSLAMGLMIASGGAGGFVFPNLASWLIDLFGWRQAWIALGVIVFVANVVVGAILLVRSRPEEMGQVPDGRTLTPTAAAARPSKVYQTPVDWSARQALRTPAFWLIAGLWGANLYALTTMMNHQVVYLQDMDFSRAWGAFTISMVSGMSIAGRLGFGLVAMRVEVRYLATICMSLVVLSILVFMNATTKAPIYLFTVLFGIGYGGLVVAEPTFLGAYFGRANYPQIMGFIQPFGAAFSALAPWLGGRLYDAYGNYDMAFTIVLALTIAGLVCTFFARPPKLPPELAAKVKQQTETSASG